MGPDLGSGQFSVTIDDRFGYRRLDPVPTAEFLEQFYSQRYMDLVSAGGRAPEVRRLLEGGPAREEELLWLRSSFYSDVEDSLSRAVGPARRQLLDLGAGTGDFLDFAIEMGWSGHGIEPSERAAERARKRGLSVDGMTLEVYRERYPYQDGAFDAMAMLNVLEHVPDPAAFLSSAKQLLSLGGVLCLSVPNDFTDLQHAAVERLGLRNWWIAAPDHINYFDYESLSRTLVGCGFEIIERTGTFPMELLLLLGVNYVDDPALGAEAHRRRVEFEAALPTDVRRRLYVALAGAGFGRNCVMTARRIA